MLSSSIYRIETTFPSNILRTASIIITQIYSHILQTPSTVCILTIISACTFPLLFSSSSRHHIHHPNANIVAQFYGIGGKVASLYLFLPVASWIHSLATRQRFLSDLYDVDGARIDPRTQSLVFPFLPEEGHVSSEEHTMIRTTLHSLVQQRGGGGGNGNVGTGGGRGGGGGGGGGWALVTGASRGIGRAISIELARYNIPIVLVARDGTKLQEVSEQIRTYYGVDTRVIVSDLTEPNAVAGLYATTTPKDDNQQQHLPIDILIHNAGVADTAELTQTDSDSIETMIRLNVGATTELLRLYGSDMKRRRRGRLAVVSSITGAVPGVPTAGVYAATKAYQRSLAASTGQEMEAYNVGVTLIMPGAVANTEFASRANMEDAWIWRLGSLGAVMTPDRVAETAVRSVLVGLPEVTVGWMNVLFLLVHELVPDRFTMLITKLVWSEFNFPLPFWKGSGAAGGDCATDIKKEL